MPDLTHEQELILVACRMAKRKGLPLDLETLVEQADLHEGHPTAQPTSAFEALEARDWLRYDASRGVYSLSDAGIDVARTVETELGQAEFGKWMLDSARSPAYAAYCQSVYDVGLIQFNMVDRLQFEALLTRLCLGPQQRILDLGCGIGTQARFIADRTGANVTGVDFSRAAIEYARSQAGPQRGRVEFSLADLNGPLPFPNASFDVIISFDTLYFVDDLEACLKRVSCLLTRPGVFAAFYTETQRSGEGPSVLEPRHTRLAQLLSCLGSEYEWLEFTERERCLWKSALAAAARLRVAFEVEGNLGLCESREQEARHCLENFDADRARRYLYFADLPLA